MATSNGGEGCAGGFRVLKGQRYGLGFKLPSCFLVLQMLSHLSVSENGCAVLACYDTAEQDVVINTPKAGV